ATLTEQQRDSWRTYARQHPRKNRLGDLTNNSGYQRFLSANFRCKRHDAAIPFLLAPCNPPLAPPLHTITASDAADTVTIALPPNTYLTPFDGLRLWLYLGAETASGVNFYSTPWRYADDNLYTDAWQTDPWTVPALGNLTAGNKIWTKLIAQDNNSGAISTPSPADVVVLA
ncbi:unnamed protein product, partial [marine sediment metagenome]